MDKNSAGECTECYLYVNIVGSKTGEKSRKDIVASSCVKSFDYDKYNKDNNFYKTKLLKIRLHPDGEKQKCYVLYASTDYAKVLKGSKLKRFSQYPISNCETLSEESTLISNKEMNDGGSPANEVNSDDETENGEGNKVEMLKKVKASRKRKAKVTKKSLENNDDMILQNYLENSDDDEDEFDEMPFKTFTPLPNRKEDKSDKRTIRQQGIRIKQLESQLKRCRKEIGNIIVQNNEECLIQKENENTANTHNMVYCSNIDQFKVHDKMFCFSREQAEQELEYNDEGNVHLGLNVYYNPIAFNDAFKCKKAFNCLSLLSEGVYGLEELSKRCVRKQKNTRNQQVLSPTKRLVIERKVYAFMRMKDYTLSQIDDFLDNLNANHRKVINGAVCRIEYSKKIEENEKEIDEGLELLT